MNYKFLSALTLAVCMYNQTIADTALVKVVDAPKVVSVDMKIGYVDYHYVLEALPEGKKANMDIQSFQKQLDNQIQLKYKEYQEKAEAAQQHLDMLTEAQKKQKVMEISKLQSAIQELEEQKYMKMERKYKDVMTPLHNRIQEVINQLAKEHHYTFIFSKNVDMMPILLFANPEFNLSDLVVEKIKSMAPELVQVPTVGPGKNLTTKVVPAQTPKQTAKAKQKSK